MWPGVSGTVGATTITVEQMPSHTHKIRIAGNTEAGNGIDAGKGNPTNMESNRVATTGGSQSHTHSLSGAKSGSASSLPPYYAGHYVIRV